MASFRQTMAVFLALSFLVVAPATAGPILLTGHDPDYHAQGQQSGTLQLQIGLNYVMGGTLNTSGKLLWIESFISPYGGHVTGANSLPVLGLTAGQDYDWVDAAGFTALVNSGGLTTANYKAVAIASTFGGMLTSAELNALGAASGALASFINAGGGLWASSESSSATTTAPHIPFYSYLPIVVLATSTSGQYAVTPFGAGLGFTNAAVNDCCTHNAFDPNFIPSALQVVDNDIGFGSNIPTTLAGNVFIQGGVIVPGVVPEPATLSLVGLGLGLAVAAHRRRRRA